ncbi:MAG: EAL domain-containing protein [Acidimicrobiales bacterium]
MSSAPQPPEDLEHQPLHAVGRRLDRAFDALTRLDPQSFLHCLQGSAESTELPQMLAERLPGARWIPTDQHPLAFVDPTDHLAVHRAWMEACHGDDRVARAKVRTVQALHPADDGPPGPVGTYDLTLIDLVGTDGVDAVVVALVPLAVDAIVPTAPAAPPRGAESFRLRLDLEGTVIGGTTSVNQLLGRPLGDVLGQPVVPLLHPDDLDPATGIWTDVLEQPEVSQTIRLRLLHGDGTWRWFTDTVWNDLDDPDSPGVLCEFHDIHEAVLAEQALHASELSFRSLAESLPVGVAVLDQDGRVHFANHQLVTILLATELGGPDSAIETPTPSGPGYTTRWSDLVDPRVVSAVEDLLRPDAPGAEPRSRQVDLVTPAGRAVSLLVRVATVADDHGLSLIVSVQDISREVSVSQAHHRVASAVDEAEEVVVVSRLRGEVLHTNKAARRFLGEDPVGRPLRELLEPEVLAMSDATIIPALEEGRPWSGDLEIVDVDGALHTMSVNVSPVSEGAEIYIGITMRDVTSRRAHERELAHQARHDTLTGLPNRFALVELLEAACATGDPDEHVAVFFIDLDNLKIVNDGLGHSAGDRLLEAVALELRRSAGTDTVARFGGDEFVVVSEGVTPEAAVERAERFLTAVERAEVTGIASSVSASIGVASLPRNEASAEALVRDADAAMYAAKRAGRSRCAIFDDALRRRVSQRFTLEALLRSSIDTDALDVHFQPIVSLEDGAVTGLEALCRWSHAGPGEFIPIAEESGLIVGLGRQVLQQSLEGAAILRASAPHLASLRIGINVSPRELDHPEFAARTLAMIEEGPVPIEHVVLELTESALIDPREEVAATLHQLRDAGLTLALDDFGSGYSSLTYLRRYPLDLLKLDISYTQAMIHDAETRVIVEALLSMANRLGMQVVAEGVETPEQLALVRELGATWAQGFLVGKPAGLDELLGSALPPRDLTPPG